MTNKRGEHLGYPLIVLFYAALVFSSLYVFSVSISNASLEFSDANFLKVIYAKEDLIRYYISEGIRTSALEIDSSETPVENFNKLFKSEIANYKFKNNYLVDFQNQIKNNEFSTTFREGEFTMRVNLELVSEQNGLKVIYRPLIIESFKK